jgi:F0F1-type ATP synthase membrane subunit b/b'
MQTAASLKQTITHLFDAVRFSDHVKELEDSARNIEGDLQMALNKLEAQTEELTNLLAAMKVEKESVLKDLSQQVDGFLATAKEHAKAKLEKSATQQLEDFRRAIATERDKALKSLEAYFASDPVPVVENLIQVRLNEGVYEARSRYECEGNIRYDFRLAAQNSRIFHQPFSFSQLGYELRVPVRFSKALLSKTRTPGFERLDQYVLADAETSGGRLRANFEKPGNGAKLKVVTSGNQADGFIGMEYSDQIQAVNVMNDPSLVAFVDMDALKKATGELVTELADLASKKVALLRLTTNGEQPLSEINCRELLQKVIGVMGPAYRASIKRIATGVPMGSGDDIDFEFVQGRLKVLGGELSSSVSQSLGLAVTR